MNANASGGLIGASMLTAGESRRAAQVGQEGAQQHISLPDLIKAADGVSGEIALLLDRLDEGLQRLDGGPSSAPIPLTPLTNAARAPDPDPGSHIDALSSVIQSLRAAQARLSRIVERQARLY